MRRLSKLDLLPLEKKIKAVESYMDSVEFSMLRESTQQDYRDYLLGLVTRYRYYLTGRYLCQ